MDTAHLAQALADSERQRRLYAAMLESTPDLVYVFDLQHRFTYANPALLEMWGCDWADAVGKTCLELGYEPWHAAMHDEEIERVVATRQPVRGDVPFNNVALGRRIYDYLFVPVLAPDGSVEAVAGTTRDVTERKQHEEAQRHSERRLRAIASASSDVIYRMDADWAGLEVVAGRTAAPGMLKPHRGWMDDGVHPDDRAQVAAAATAARRAGTVFDMEYRVRHDDGHWHWIASRVVPVVQADGTVDEWVGAATDIDARKRQERQQTLLMDELNHRVKNTLAIVQSIAIQTLRGGAATGEDPVERFEARLLALSKAHDLLTATHWKGARLHDVLAAAIAPCTGGNADRFDIQGPAVCLEPRQALALSMALHELCTNACKYGALSTPAGRIAIGWDVHEHDGARHLSFRWRESGGPRVSVPAASGFGTRLVERGLRHDLGGTVQLDFPPTGVTCHITAPLNTREDSHD